MTVRAPAIAAMERASLRFDALLKPPHLAPFLQFLRRHPRLAIVVDHGAKPEIRNGQFDDWAAAMRTIAHDERVHCKLSGLVTEAYMAGPWAWRSAVSSRWWRSSSSTTSGRR